MRTVVIGHVEWIEFGLVDHVPRAGEIVHATDWWEGPGGGGAVSAVQLAKLAGSCTFFTALGNDDTGRRVRRELEGAGLRTEVALREERTRRAVTFVDPAGERTITTLGRRLQPETGDDLPWDGLREADVVFFTAGDPAALRAARRARVLVATSRVLDTVLAAGAELDALVGSGRDPAERVDPDRLPVRPRLLVLTDGDRGGSFATAEGRTGRYEPVPPPGPIADTYGVGDSFVAGLAYALGAGAGPEDALALAARCGAHAATGRGPFGGQLTAAQL